MRVVKTDRSLREQRVSVAGVDYVLRELDDMEPEDLLVMLAQAVVQERRTNLPAYPLVEETVLAKMMEY